MSIQKYLILKPFIHIKITPSEEGDASPTRKSYAFIMLRRMSIETIPAVDSIAE